MADIEIAEFGSALGSATICGDLICAVKGQLASAYRVAMSGTGPSWRSLSFLLAAFERRRPFRILRRQPGCRVCEIGVEAAEFHARSLLQWLSDEEACAEDVLNGAAHLCLLHLDLTLRDVQRGTVRGALRLALLTLAHLARLEADLEEYAGKHAWDRRDEPMTAAGEISWRAALAFLAGEPRPGERCER